MTLAELATEVGARLNLTSTESVTRVKRELNEAYRRVTSSIGLQTARRVSGTSQSTTADNPRITYTLEKIERLYITSAKDVLEEVSYDEIKSGNVENSTTGTPRRWAVESHTHNTVTVFLDPVPSGIVAILADGYQNASTLGDSDSPAFPTDFHDLLIDSVMEVEYMKLEKPDLARLMKGRYEERLAQLRYFIVKSNSNATKQGSRANYWRKTFKHNGNRIA
jgi:hypothetical protein